MKDRDVYVEQMKHQLDKWNSELDKFQAKISTAAEKTRAEYASRIDDLREKRKALETRLRTLKASGDDAWGEMREGVENAWTVLNRSLKDARTHFSSEESADAHAQVSSP